MSANKNHSRIVYNPPNNPAHCHDGAKHKSAGSKHSRGGSIFLNSSATQKTVTAMDTVQFVAHCMGSSASMQHAENAYIVFGGEETWATHGKKTEEQTPRT